MLASRECKQIVFLLMLLGVLAGVQFRDRIRRFIAGEGYQAGFVSRDPSDAVPQDKNDLSDSFTPWRRPAPVPEDLNDPMTLE